MDAMKLVFFHFFMLKTHKGKIYLFGPISILQLHTECGGKVKNIKRKLCVEWFNERTNGEKLELKYKIPLTFVLYVRNKKETHSFLERVLNLSMCVC